MTENLELVGHITPTTPPSSPLDTLKAVTMRTIDQLEYVIDQLGGGSYDVSEDLIDFVDSIKQMQFAALAEHVPVALDEKLGELRYVHPSGTRYDDGSLVVEWWEDQYGTMMFYPRYDGDRAKKLDTYREWVAANRAAADTSTVFGEIIRGIDWGSNGPASDL